MLTRTTATVLVSLVIAAFAAGCGDSSSGSGSTAPAATGGPAATTAAAAAPAPAGTGKPTAAECAAIPKHFLEISLAEDEDFRKASPAERELIRTTMQAELANDSDVKAMTAECAKDMTRKEYNCILAAKNTKALDKCTDE